MHIAFVTWSGLPQLASDDQLVREELQREQHDVTAAVWDDASIDWRSFDAIVIRSTWDYHKRTDDFRAWLASLGDAPLWNPRAIVERNLHKSYLLDIPNAVPSRIVQPGTQVEIRERSVVKPVVSATAYRTTIVDRPFIAELESIVQPFVEEVTTKGEWSLIFFAGEFSHAVLKRAKDGDFRVQNDFGGTAVAMTPPRALIEDAHAILESIKTPWLYARVDGVERDGHLLLMELEMTEPSLFLDREAALRFSKAICRAAGSQPAD